MKKVWYLLNLMIPFLLFWSGCTAPEGNPVGGNFFGTELLDVAGPVWIPLKSAEASRDSEVSTSKSSYLYVYRQDGPEHQVQSVLQFAPPDSGQILEARLQLIQRRATNETPSSFAINVWSQEWQDAVDQNTLLAAAPLTERLGTLTIENADSDTFSLDLDPAWVESWTDTNGLILMPDQNDVFLECYSNDNSSYNPGINLKILTGVEDTTEVTLYPVVDWFVTNRPSPANENGDHLILDNATSDRIRLTFDLSALDKTVTINRATLWLRQATNIDGPLSEETFAFQAFPVTDDSGESLEYDVGYSAIGVLGGDSSAVEIQGMTQSWNAELLENKGLVLLGASEKSGITWRGIKIDASQAPKLEVYYTPSITIAGE